jgi:mRNA interferase RelE/StbE
MVYKVVLRRRVVKALEEMNEPHYTAVKVAVYDLAVKPRPHGYRKLKGREGYRIRVADYRIIYDIIDDVLMVVVIGLGHRREIYKK